MDITFNNVYIPALTLNFKRFSIELQKLTHEMIRSITVILLLFLIGLLDIEGFVSYAPELSNFWLTFNHCSLQLGCCRFKQLSLERSLIGEKKKQIISNACWNIRYWSLSYYWQLSLEDYFNYFLHVYPIPKFLSFPSM